MKLEFAAAWVAIVSLASCGTDAGSGPDDFEGLTEEGIAEVTQLLENDVGASIIPRYMLGLNGFTEGDSAMVVEGVASHCDVLIPSAVVEFQNDSSMTLALDVIRDCVGTAQDHPETHYHYSASFEFVRSVYEVQADLCDPWESCFDLTIYESDSDPHPIVESAKIGFSLNLILNPRLSPAPFCVATGLELGLRLRDPEDYLLNPPRLLNLILYPDPDEQPVIVQRVQFVSAVLTFSSCR